MCVSVCQCNHCDRKNTCTDCTYNEANKNVSCTPPFGKGVQNCPEYKAFKYVTVPKFEYKPIPEETLLKMDYKSPIEAIIYEMEMRFENDVMNVVRQYDIFVDKDELIKALQYDRDQYRKGFEDGSQDNADALIEQTKADTVRKMQGRFTLHFGTYTDKDTVKVLDVFKLIDQFGKEILGENK